MTFRVGQKVVRINGVWKNQKKQGYGDEIPPTTGEIYTIRWIGTELFRPTCVRLNELTNKERPYSDTFGRKVLWEPSFNANRFRPLVENEKTTDISIFTDLLIPTKEFVNG